MAEYKNYTLNFGPVHPAAHGVLRLILELDGETVVRADPHVGLLHRGTEKLAEFKPYNQNIGYMDRLDYVSMMCNEHSYVIAIEKLLELEVPGRAKYIRVMFAEMTRLLSHLLWAAACGIDLGAMTVFLYAFRIREDLFDCYEAVSGARMHAAYFRPGGVARDLPAQMPKYKESRFTSKRKTKKINENRQGSMLDFLDSFVVDFDKSLKEIDTLLTDNRLWKQRNVGIGVVTAERAKELGFTGPMLRASGVEWDLRRTQPYEVYDKLDFDVPIGSTGDCYDRYLVRMAEMSESNKIIKQCVDWLRANPGEVLSDNHKFTAPKRNGMKNDMEQLIHHFKHCSEGYCTPEGEVYVGTEHPKGEFGVYIKSDGANKPYRLKMRAPGFAHISAMNEMLSGHMLSDVPAIVSTIDVVFGDVDR